MAEEDNEAEGKKKFSRKKLIIIVLVLLIVAGGAAAGLYFTGMLGGKPEPTAEEKLQKMEEQAAAANGAPAPPGAPGAAVPIKRVTKQSPELTRYQQHYLELERDFVVNLTNSRKVMQVQIALMTHYDNRVFDNVKKHEFALRSVTLDVMRQATDVDLARPNFRTEMAEKIRTEMNTVLEKYEDFGGIEAVFFTNFVIQ
jgi:flagellar FliL protein